MEEGVLASVSRGLMVKACPPMLFADLRKERKVVKTKVSQEVGGREDDPPGENESRGDTSRDGKVVGCVVSVESVDGSKVGQNGSLERVWREWREKESAPRFAYQPTAFPTHWCRRFL
jgi:hypothetical protein